MLGSLGRSVKTYTHRWNAEGGSTERTRQEEIALIDVGGRSLIITRFAVNDRYVTESSNSEAERYWRNA